MTIFMTYLFKVIHLHSFSPHVGLVLPILGKSKAVKLSYFVKIGK